MLLGREDGACDQPPRARRLPLSTRRRVLVSACTGPGWSRELTSGAVTLNLVVFGLTAPFAAALMERFGSRRVVASALLLVAVGSGLTTLMVAPWAPWELVALWGVVTGMPRSCAAGTKWVPMSPLVDQPQMKKVPARTPKVPDRDASASARSATRRGGAARASGCVFRLRLPAAAAAGPLAVICVLDTVGTVASGWFTDRVDARVLLDVAVRTAEPAAA